MRNFEKSAFAIFSWTFLLHPPIIGAAYRGIIIIIIIIIIIEDGGITQISLGNFFISFFIFLTGSWFLNFFLLE